MRTHLRSTSPSRSPRRKRATRSPLGDRVTDFVFSFMKIDDEWSVREDAGFSWWLHFLRQRVWFEPLAPADGRDACRVHVTTDLLEDFRETDANLHRLFALQPLVAPLAAIARDPEREGRIRLEAALTVTEDFEVEAATRVAWVAALTAAIAHRRAELVARLTGSRIHRSAHPVTGERREADGLIEILRQTVGVVAHRDSFFAGERVAAAREALEQISVMFPGQDDDDLTAEFPFSPTTALLRVLTSVTDPRLGNGALLALTLPGGTNDAATARIALELNGAEAREGADLIGSWIPHAPGLTYVTFLPNAVHNSFDLSDVAAQQGARAAWAADRGVALPRPDVAFESPEEALAWLAVPGVAHWGRETVHEPWWRILDGKTECIAPLPLEEGELEWWDGTLLVSWGIFNPAGPTVSALLYLPFGSGEAGVIVYVMLNPFGQERKIVATVGEEGIEACAIRLLAELFARNDVGEDGSALVLVGSPPTWIAPQLDDETFLAAVPEMFASNPGVASSDLDTEVEGADADPWDRATAAFRRAMLAYKRNYLRLVDPEEQSTTDPEETFARWWAHVTDPDHVASEIRASFAAWSGSIGMMASLGDRGGWEASNAWDEERLRAFLGKFNFTIEAARDDEKAIRGAAAGSSKPVTASLLRP